MAAAPPGWCPQGDLLRLDWRPYRFELPRQLVTSQGAWSLRQGWLLRMEAADGRLGWGEAALPPATPQAIDDGGSRPDEASVAGSAARDRRGSGPTTPLEAFRGTGPAPGQTATVRRDPSVDCNERGAAHKTNAPPSRGAVREIPLAAAPEDLPPWIERQTLEALLPQLPHPQACALGMALAELDGLGCAERGGWLAAPPSAVLLPAGRAAIAALEQALEADRAWRARRPRLATHDPARSGQAAERDPGPAALHRGKEAQAGAGLIVNLTVKWKVAAGDDATEREVLEALLERLPSSARLRLDANGGWDRSTADRWAERLEQEPRLDWLEQPLSADDLPGLEALARRVPVALDESLRTPAALQGGVWPGWQVRRPLAEGDPRPLLAALEAGTPRLMLSTALETGIGRRLLHHLAALQSQGPTPTAPGLAPGWCPEGGLFAAEPALVWEAAQ